MSKKVGIIKYYNNILLIFNDIIIIHLDNLKNTMCYLTLGVFILSPLPFSLKFISII